MRCSVATKEFGSGEGSRSVLALSGSYCACRERKSDVFMAMLRTGQIAAPPNKGGGRCVVRKPDSNQAGGSEDPHAPPAMERERIASRRHTKGDADRKSTRLNSSHSQ